MGGEGTNRNPSRRSLQQRRAAAPPWGLSGCESAGQGRRPGDPRAGGDPTSRGTTLPARLRSRARAPPLQSPRSARKTAAVSPHTTAREGPSTGEERKPTGGSRAVNEMNTSSKRKEELLPWGYGTCDKEGNATRLYQQGHSSRGSLAPEVWATLGLCRGSQKIRRQSQLCQEWRGALVGPGGR